MTQKYSKLIFSLIGAAIPLASQAQVLVDLGFNSTDVSSTTFTYTGLDTAASVNFGTAGSMGLTGNSFSGEVTDASTAAGTILFTITAYDRSNTFNLSSWSFGAETEADEISDLAAGWGIISSNGGVPDISGAQQIETDEVFFFSIDLSGLTDLSPVVEIGFSTALAGESYQIWEQTGATSGAVAATVVGSTGGGSFDASSTVTLDGFETAGVYEFALIPTDTPLRIAGISLDVVPEPSTYGLISGTLLLGFVIFRRRRV